MIASIVFQCDTLSIEVFEWLQSTGVSFDISGSEAETHKIDIDKYAYKIVGRRNPIEITIRDEDVALMFRIKCPNSYVIRHEYRLSEKL